MRPPRVDLSGKAQLESSIRLVACHWCFTHSLWFNFTQSSPLCFILFKLFIAFFLECNRVAVKYADSFTIARRKWFYGLYFGSTSLYIGKNVAEIKRFALLGSVVWSLMVLWVGELNTTGNDLWHLSNRGQLLCIVLCIQKTCSESLVGELLDCSSCKKKRSSLCCKVMLTGRTKVTPAYKVKLLNRSLF